MMTPYEKLKSMPNSEKYLKDGVAFAMTDNQSADRLQQARQSLKWNLVEIPTPNYRFDPLPLFYYPLGDFSPRSEACGLKPPSFRRFLFQSAVQFAEIDFNRSNPPA
jgi:hypothetical protein